MPPFIGMESLNYYSNTLGGNQGNLTQLYSDAKNSALSNVRKEDTTPALSSLHRELRIQKDRLVTWGIEWSEEGNGPDGSIDEPVAEAGLTETVTSVLGNIKEVLEQAEQIRSSAIISHSPRSATITQEKRSWFVVDESKYEDLVKDLTTSIDILYDLSRSRIALAQGAHPAFLTDISALSTATGSPELSKFRDAKKRFARTPSIASSERTLVNPPSFSRPSLSPYAGLPPVIDRSALVLPEECPPPYHSVGSPSPTRMMGQLLLGRVSDIVLRTMASQPENPYVLVEFANFDPLYRDARVLPPLHRLEYLNGILNSQGPGAPVLLGYFEDRDQPRIGLVYDVVTESQALNSSSSAAKGSPIVSSLLHILQTASKTAKSMESARPAETALSMTPLEQRMRLAVELTGHLRHIHAQKLSHGNVNSSSVTFMHKRPLQMDTDLQLQFSFLSSFDLFPQVRGHGSAGMFGFSIYKHPGDGSGSSDLAEKLRYDFYGLGLVLLEIGLWAPLGDLYKPKYTLHDFKLRLEKIWIPKLAAKCGSAYMRAVQTCFQFADDPFGEIAIEVVYENMLERLQRCICTDNDMPLLTRHRGSGQDCIGALPEGDSTKKKRAHSGRNIPMSFLSSTSEKKSISLPHVSPADRCVSTAIPQSAKPSPAPLARSPLRTDPSSTASPARVTEPRQRSHPSTELTRVASFKQGMLSAANTMRREWHSRGDSPILPFREYRRKVMLIQACWRHRSKIMKSQELSGPAHAPAGLARRSSDHTFERPEAQYVPAEVRESDQQTSRGSRLRVFPVKLPQTALDSWHTDVGLRLSRVIERALKDSPESSSIDLVGLGPDALSARPTILVTCTSTARVKAALRRKFDYDRNTFDVKVRRGRITLSRGKSKRDSGNEQARRSSGRGDEEFESDDIVPQNPYWQQRPLCGASIGAYLPDYGHLLPVSLGGIILVDDKPYGMSVHHMLEPPSDNEDEDEDGDRELDAIQEATDSEVEVAVRSSGRTPRSIFPRSSHGSFRIKGVRDEDDGNYLSDILSSDDDANYASSGFESDASDGESLDPAHMSASHSGRLIEIGDTDGYMADDDHDVTVTQPALEDAIAQNLHADDIPQEDQDEDHLLSYALGKIHASSGLRRCGRNGMRHEIDWALVALDPPRLQPYNLIQGGRRFCTAKQSFCPNLSSPICRRASQFAAVDDLYPVAVAPATALADLAVHTFARTSGLSKGCIGAGMSFVKIYGRRTFSSSWAVVGDFGIGGDSGSWVIDNATGAVCGHVLAERQGLTYICPMELLLEDIKAVLGAKKVVLPGSETEIKAVVEVAKFVSAASGRTRDSLADAVAGLGIGGAANAPAAMQSRMRKAKLVGCKHSPLLSLGQAIAS